MGGNSGKGSGGAGSADKFPVPQNEQQLGNNQRPSVEELLDHVKSFQEFLERNGLVQWLQQLPNSSLIEQVKQDFIKQKDARDPTRLTYVWPAAESGPGVSGNRRAHASGSAEVYPCVKCKDLEESKRQLRGTVSDRNNKINALQKELEASQGNLRLKKQDLEAAASNLESLKLDYHRQLVAADSRNANQADARGMYAASGATPLNLNETVDDIRLSLEGFSRLLMKVVNKEEHWKDAEVTALGIKWGRPGHFKFHLQRQIAEVCFDKLWDSDEYFFFPCSPLGSGISHGQKQFYSLYEQVSDKASRDNLVTQLANAGNSPAGPVAPCKVDCASWQQGSSTAYCTCWAEVWRFCLDIGLKALKNLEVWQKCVEFQNLAETDRFKLLESFFNLLVDVWRAHLVSLAFEQPACLFKVKKGQIFVGASMDDAVPPDTKDPPRKVEFMITPGFRVGKTVIKSLAYTSLEP